MDNSIAGLLALGALIVLNALLKVAYVALINARKPELKELGEEGDARARRAYTLANDATRLLASQQLLDLLLRFTIAVTAAVTIAPPLRDALLDQGTSVTVADLLAYGLVLLAAAVLTLIFGEMLPTNIALGYPNAISLRAAGTVGAISWLLAPALRFLQWVSGQVAAPFVGLRRPTMVTEEEIKLMVDAGSEGGAIESEEKEMIYSIFQFGDTLTREVMVPRIDVVALDIRAPLEEALNAIVQAGHSRIPVYEDSIDHIRGVLYAKDLLSLWQSGDTGRPIREILRPAFFVPETKKADDLLADMQTRKVHLVIVVDEYGGTAGLVTLEDLIEEIVGEIRDEYDINEEESYQKVGDFEYIVDAGIDLDDLNRLLDIDLPTDESDTLGGFVLSKLGEVPSEGQRMHTNGLEIEVLSVDDRRIRKIRVTVLPRPVMPTGDTREEPAAAPD